MLNILFLHNRYRYLGGEDKALDAELNLLRSKDVIPTLFELENDSIDRLYHKVKTGIVAYYSRFSRNKVLSVINECSPDLVHVHNFFPLLTPSVYDACIESKIPVVQTLHNYRTICPGALLVRNGKICEKCMVNSPYQAFLHGCYRDSRLASLAVARMVSYHRSVDTWGTKVDQFIALTEFAKSKFVEAGFLEEKISVKPNFIDTPVYNEPKERQGALFVGRLSNEKGLLTLIRSWESLEYPLYIAGSGPLEDKKASMSSSFVRWLGHCSSDRVRKEMMNAQFLIMPSECYETFGMVIIEAFSSGLPVLASRMGSMAELVTDNVTGLLFETGKPEDLAAKVKWMIANPDKVKQMGRNARKEYEEKYTPERNYDILMDIYDKAIRNHSDRK